MGWFEILGGRVMIEMFIGIDCFVGVSLVELLVEDSYLVIDVFRVELFFLFGNIWVFVFVYYLKEWYDREVVELWSKVW